MGNRPKTILDDKGYCWYKNAFINENLRYLRYYIKRSEPSDKDENHLYNLYTSLKVWMIIRSVARTWSSKLQSQIYLDEHYFELIQPGNDFVYFTKWDRKSYPIQLITPLDDCALLVETGLVKEELTEIFAGDTVVIPTQGRITLISKTDKVLPFWIAKYTFEPFDVDETYPDKVHFTKPTHKGIYAKNTEV